jgi:class 3 adenylate cyclase/tetratricopeptide (TPR) repeat protein
MLQRYIPRELLNRLETARQAGMVEGERRVVTILFSDVKGSTSAAASLDPEEWAEIINGAFEYMIRPVYAFEGTVARLMGDGLLAFFGAPIAHEDDPQRAVFAGLEILNAIEAYADRIKQRWGLDFTVRVGINTGLVVVGAVGSDLRLEYTALGDAINLAARMEQTARPGTVQIAEPTHKLVAPLFDFEVIDNLEVKGKDTPMRAFRVLGARAVPGRLRGIEGLHAPLVGRDGPMGALSSAIRGLQEGSGQILSLIGEAGLGKSRLVAELRREVATDTSLGIRWLEGRALSYETATPFSPFIKMFSSYFGLGPSTPDPEKYSRLVSALEPYFHEEDAVVAPIFGTLLGLEMEESEAERVKYLEPPHLRSLIFAHVSGLIERMVAQQPLILVLDDLHWSDPTSMDLLSSLLPLTDRAPLMVITAFRPRRQESSWTFHEIAGRDFHHRYRAIELEPLDESQSRQLVGSLLEIEDLPEKVRRLILEKSEGNPFFVEEIIRSLLDGGSVVQEDGHWRATEDIVSISIPDTLVGVITARLDRLDEPARRVVQAASIIGREFSTGVLADLIDDANLLPSVLPELQRRDLLKERGRLPSPVYAFKHVLTQEAAYGSLLLSNRRELHHRAAKSLTTHSPDQAAEIARHFIEARQPVQALPYLVAAGDQAARAYAAVEAINYYKKAIELQDRVDGLDPIRRAYEGLGGVLNFANRIPEAQQTYQDMLSLAEARDDAPMQISALNKLGSLFALSMGQFQEAEGFLARSEALIRKHEEKTSFPELAIIRCMMCTAQADFDHAVQYMGEVVAIGEEYGNQEHIAMGLEHVANSLAYMTRFDEAMDRGRQALAVARQAGDRLHEASLLTSLIPIVNIRNGDFTAARDALQQGLQIARRIQALNPQVEGGWLLAELARWQGDYERALEFGLLSLEAALPLEEYMPFEVVLPLSSLGSIYLDISPRFTDKIAEFHRHALRLLETPIGAILGGAAWADLGFCAMALGDFQLAEESIQKGLNYPTVFSLLERARLLTGAALVALNKNDVSEARRLVDEGRAYAEERDMRHVYPLIALIDGKVHIAAGQTERGLRSFERAESLAGSLDMRPIIWRARAAAAETLLRAGAVEQAAAKGAAARATVEEIAGLFSDPDLRSAYLDNALVRLQKISTVPN